MSERLQKAIAQAINSVSAENGSNTPDFILAELLTDCLAAFDKASRAREKWYGKSLSIGGEVAAPPVPASGGPFWGDPNGNIHRISGKQEIVAVTTDKCTKEEWLMLCNVVRQSTITGKQIREALNWADEQEWETPEGWAQLVADRLAAAPASQPDAWTAARHWLLTDDTPNDIALEEGSRRIASLARLLASRASQPEQPGKVPGGALGKLLGTIHDRFNEREPHTGAWNEQRIVVAEVIRAALAALASPGSQPLRSAISAAWKDDAFQARVNEVVDAAQEGQPPEADLEYVRNLAATDISNEIPLTDAQFNWLQERLRKLVRATSRGESA